MKIDPAALVKVVKPEDKQSLLSKFLATALAADQSRSGDARSVSATLIAHSPTSPAARALVAFSTAGEGVSIELRAIFASAGTTVASAEHPAPTLQGVTWIATSELRDERLHNAHEQIVLDGRITWIGDCLRRDPAKRDAYETYAAADPVTTRWAELAFERLSRLATPCAIPGAGGIAIATETTAGDTGTTTAPPAPEAASLALAATQH